MPSRRTVLASAGIGLAGATGGCLGQLSPLRWTEKGELARTTGMGDPVRWRVTGDYRAVHAPAICEDTVFVNWSSPGDDGPGAVSGVGTDGTVRWHWELPTPPNRRSGPSATFDGDYYVVTGRDTWAAGYDQRLWRFGPDGTERWRTDTRGQFLTLLGFGDGRAYVGSNNDEKNVDGMPLRAVSIDDGAWDWTAETGDSDRGLFRDGQLLVGIAAGAVAVHDPETGGERWRADAEPLWSADGRMAVHDDALMARRGPSVVSLDRRDGSMRWSFVPDGVTMAPTGAAVGAGTVVVTDYDGSVLALDPMAGTERWRVEVGGDVPWPPLFVDGTIFVGDDAGTVTALDAATGSPQWRVGTPSPVVDLEHSSRTLVARSAGDRHVITAVDATGGSKRWQYESTTRLDGFSVREDRVYATESGGDLLALG